MLKPTQRRFRLSYTNTFAKVNITTTYLELLRDVIDGKGDGQGILTMVMYSTIITSTHRDNQTVYTLSQ